MLMKYSFFTKASAVLAVSTALLFAVPVFAQTADMTAKVSFFERIGMFFSARKQERLEKLKEFVSETVIEEPIVTPIETPTILPLPEGEMAQTLPQAAVMPFESQKLAPMEQESLFNLLSQ